MAAGPTATEVDAPGRLRYVPALDGLRGLAVAAVLLYHQGLEWAGGGFLGVSLFFTLSGFLITSLLVGEHRATGRLDLRAFWLRRVRRLAPAGLLGIAMAVATLVVAVPVAQQAAVIGDIRAALLQLVNWRFVLAESPYVDLGTLPSPLQHYWSLAIEEQFYLVLPLLVLLALRRGSRRLALVLGVVVVTSFGLQLVLPPTDRVYFGTDTRAAELAVGALLALGWTRLPDRWRHAPAWDGVAVVALATTGVLWVVAEHTSPLLLGGGLTAVAVVSAALLAGVMGGRVVPGLLAVAPLRGLGIISYGVYVIHFPVFLVLTPGRVGASGAVLFAVRVAATLAVAVPFYLLVERPVRHGRPVLGVPLRGRLAGAAAVTAMLGLVLVTVPLQRAIPPPVTPTGLSALPAAASPDDPGATAVAVPGDRGQDGEEAGEATAAPTTDASPRPQETATEDPGPTPLPTPDTPATTAPAAPGGPPDPDPNPDPDPDPAAEPRPPRLVVVGDSTAEANGTGLQAWGQRTGGVQVSVVASPGCAVHTGEVARYRVGVEFRPYGCDRLFPTAAEEVRRVDADAVVVFLGAPQLADWRFRGEQTWHDITEAAFADAYRQRLHEALATARVADVPVLWADVPVPDWDLDQFGDMVASDFLGVGEPVINDPARVRVLNDITTAVVDEHAGVTTVAYTAGLAGPDGTIAPGDRADGLHLSSEQVQAAADTWLMAALEDAWVRAWAELDRPPPDGLSWSSASVTR